MKKTRIPSVLALVASLALLGCGDLGTAPSLDELGPEFRGAPPSECPPGFEHVDLAGSPASELNDPNLVDGNGDGHVCKGTRGGKTFFTDNNAGSRH